MMKHDDIRHRLSEYLDNAVTRKEKAEIEEHLTSCTKCSDALAELRKTIQHVKEIEEADPPAWMTQKIMAKVREEAEQKKSIFRRLFYPLHVKLPIEAVAVAFLTITAFYIYQSIQPQMKMAEAPMEGYAAKQETPSPVIARNEKGDSSLRSEQAPQSMKSKKETEFQSDKFAAPAATPAPRDERIMKEQESVATAGKREEAKPFAGLMAQDEAPREAPATAAKAKAFAFAKKKDADIQVTVRVKDVETATKEIEKAIAQLAGKVIKAESLENKKVITVELSPDKANALFEKLKLIGEVEEKTLTSTNRAGNVEMRIAILKK